MSKVGNLKLLVKQRLTASADEIFELFERTIAEYEEELCRSGKDDERLRNRLDAVLKPDVRLHRTGSLANVQLLLNRKEGVPPPDQAQDREEPETTPIKKKQVDLTGTSVPLNINVKTHTNTSPQEVKLTQHRSVQSKGNRFSCRACERSFTRLYELCEHQCGGGEPQLQVVWTPQDIPVKYEEDEEQQPWATEQPEANGDFGSDLLCDPGHDERETGEDCLCLDLLINDENNPQKRWLHCLECGKQFKKTSRLKAHMKIHTKEKPFSCLVCGKSFVHVTSEYAFQVSQRRETSHLSLLQAHMTCHTGGKAFSCPTCLRSFTWKNQLRKHKCDGAVLKYYPPGDITKEHSLKDYRNLKPSQD